MRRLAAGLLALLGALVAALGLAALGGWRLLAVESESMAPAIPRRSLAVVSPVAASAVGPGDVIVFHDPVDRRRRVLHRVVSVVDEGRAFVTRGDANQADDPMSVPARLVTGRLRWHLPGVGAAAAALAPPGGLVVLIGGPLLALALTETRRARGGAGRSVSPFCMETGDGTCQ